MRGGRLPRAAALGLALGLLACGKGGKGDDCQTFVDRSRPIMADMMKTGGRTLSDADVQRMLDGCRKGDAKKDPVFACVLAAKDDAAVRACYLQGMSSYKAKAQTTEAKLMLSRLGKNLKVAVLTEAKLPAGKAGPSPAGPCCGAEGNKCPPPNWAADPVWSALDFVHDEPTSFRYAYESDGTSFTATATGDLDCDGTEITYRLTGKVENGELALGQVEEPAPDAD